MDNLFEKAVCFASDVHKGVKRKYRKIPYLVHPLEVAVIASSMTDDEEVMAAAVLHDTVEDTSTTIEQIKEEFGDRVALLVSSETEDKMRNIPPDQTWYIRKKQALEELEKAEDIGIKIIWLSDKLSNMRSLAAIKRECGKDMWNIFNQKEASAHEWYYRSVLKLTEELKEHFAYKEYCKIVEFVFGGEENV